MVNLGRNLWPKNGKKRNIYLGRDVTSVILKCWCHKVSNYFAVCGPPVGQQYVYHAGRRWTTDGPPVANLTIFSCNKI